MSLSDMMYWEKENKKELFSVDYKTVIDLIGVEIKSTTLLYHVNISNGHGDLNEYLEETLIALHDCLVLLESLSLRGKDYQACLHELTLYKQNKQQIMYNESTEESNLLLKSYIQGIDFVLKTIKDTKA